jgi:hypothetical protein
MATPTMTMVRRKKPGKGSRLRASETYRVTGNFDAETVEQARALAERDGISLAEQLRQLVEFGLEVVQEGEEQCFSSSK